MGFVSNPKKNQISIFQKKWNKPNNPRTLIKQIFARMMIEPDYYTSMKNILASPQKVAKNWLFVERNDELLNYHTYALQDPLHEKKKNIEESNPS